MRHVYRSSFDVIGVGLQNVIGFSLSNMLLILSICVCVLQCSFRLNISVCIVGNWRHHRSSLPLICGEHKSLGRLSIEDILFFSSIACGLRTFYSFDFEKDRTHFHSVNSVASLLCHTSAQTDLIRTVPRQYLCSARHLDTIYSSPASIHPENQHRKTFDVHNKQ